MIKKFKYTVQNNSSVHLRSITNRWRGYSVHLLLLFVLQLLKGSLKSQKSGREPTNQMIGVIM